MNQVWEGVALKDERPLDPRPSHNFLAVREQPHAPGP